MKTLKKVLKISAIGLGLVALAGVGLFIAFVMPASADSVCENLYTLSQTKFQQELAVEYSRDDVEKMLDQTYDECVADVSRWLDFSQKSGIEKARISKCRANAETIAAFESCS